MQEKDRKKLDAMISVTNENIGGWAREDLPDDLSLDQIPDWWFEDDDEMLDDPASRRGGQSYDMPTHSSKRPGRSPRRR